MAMRYDPIMCMMVDDSVKTKDANKDVEKEVKLIKEGKGPIAILSTLKGMGLTPADANSYYAEAKSLTGYRSYDEKTIDKAIRSADSVSTTDAAIDEFKKTKELCKQIIAQYSGKPIGRKIDGNYVLAHAKGIIDKMDYYIENAGRGWYD